MKVALIAPRSVTYVKGNRNTKLPTNLGTVGCADGSNSSEMSKSSWMNRKDSKGQGLAPLYGSVLGKKQPEQVVKRLTQIYILLSVEARG